jgi:hypothetical protein
VNAIAKPAPILAAFSILLSVAFLTMGNGLQLMLLPIRGGIEGFSAFQLGLLGSGYLFSALCSAAPAPLDDNAGRSYPQLCRPGCDRLGVGP